MSCLENDKIMEAFCEDFIGLYETSESFATLIRKLISTMEKNNMPLIGCKTNEDCIGEIVKRLWSFDSELLFASKRDCVEACIMYINSMGELKKLTK